ncbi:ATP-binding cassette domain-containing protein [Nonomuraea sp. NPDC048881]|uniref:ATP-binding cassette domain-containing protein n=1 Tax=Nonomuraea sp. NPDC048881 TaxID=3155030 RepID=UPI0033FCFD72
MVGQLFALPYGYFTLRGTSDLVMSTQSAASLRAMPSGQVLSALLDGPPAVVLVILVLASDPVLGGCLAAMAAVQVVLLILTRRRIADLTGRGLTAAATTQGRLIESMGGLDGGPSLGTMLALNALAVSALTPLTSLLTGLQELQEAGAHVERLADIVEAEPERTGGARPPLRGQVPLSGVGFRFDPRSPWTLRDVTLRIDPGQKVALVGSSGSGKSTLGRILLGRYEPVEGEIRYDGAPARDLDPGWLRSRFGVVTQDPHLFTGPSGRASPWCGPCCPSRGSCCWTRPPATWTPWPKRPSSTTSRPCR